jgi:diguanylate cyclase (GGDEF)-like protein
MRILIADDDATSRLLIKAIVTKQGHECLVAEDGSRAWEILRTQGIDVLLTDWMMPGLNGLELCRRVRSEVSQRYVYIVLITAMGCPEQVLDGMGAGADDYLIKPADPFAVQTRLVAAERVTSLHHQVADYRIQLERANLELIGESLTDPLTGLGNRRSLETELLSAHARALRFDRNYSVAMFDIDHFKLYNDHYGHLAGDEALQRVAECLDEVVRASENVYRFGGEEFLLVMPECTGATAVLAAERICKAVAEMGIPHEAQSGSPHVLTISGGVSCWTPSSPLTAFDIVNQADQALYRAKSAGRNCVRLCASFLQEEAERALIGR